MQRMPHFSANRAKTDVRSTSRLSPHLHHGEISTRHNYYVVSCACHCTRTPQHAGTLVNVLLRAVLVDLKMAPIAPQVVLTIASQY